MERELEPVSKRGYGESLHNAILRRELDLWFHRTRTREVNKGTELNSKERECFHTACKACGTNYHKLSPRPSI